MHDHHAVNALVQQLASGFGDPRRITEVRVRAGAIYSAESLAQAYEMLTQETPLEGSRLVVSQRRDRFACVWCGTAWAPSCDDIAGFLVLCPSCGAPSPLEDAGVIEVLDIEMRPAGGIREAGLARQG